MQMASGGVLWLIQHPAKRQQLLAAMWIEYDIAYNASMHGSELWGKVL